MSSFDLGRVRPLLFAAALALPIAACDNAGTGGGDTPTATPPTTSATPGGTTGTTTTPGATGSPGMGTGTGTGNTGTTGTGNTAPPN